MNEFLEVLKLVFVFFCLGCIFEFARVFVRFFMNSIKIKSGKKHPAKTLKKSPPKVTKKQPIVFRYDGGYTPEGEEYIKEYLAPKGRTGEVDPNRKTIISANKEIKKAAEEYSLNLYSRKKH